MTGIQAAPPQLSTPDTHIFEQEVSTTYKPNTTLRPSEEQLYIIYEIERTILEIRHGRWKRIALQFPDHMLVDAPLISQALSQGLSKARKTDQRTINGPRIELSETGKNPVPIENYSSDIEEQLYILADTSYGSCCVDEIAAEHANADVVVHYGRSCLSPTARLPVIYVFTKPSFEMEPCIEAFKQLYHDHERKIILMADIPYSNHLPELNRRLSLLGYSNLFVTSLIHDVSSPLPNRTIPNAVLNGNETLEDWQLFHISDPPQALLLTLSSRVGEIHIYSTSTESSEEVKKSSRMILRRRYALLTSLSTTPIFGILINTLSVRNYIAILNHVKNLIAVAGKKSYTFVVGKVNPAKIANFSEVGGWVVIGCWESSLFDNNDFWKPLITPFELELALKGDEERVWTGQWTSDFQRILEEKKEDVKEIIEMSNGVVNKSSDESSTSKEDSDEQEESEPPEFDLRTGRYVSHSRPMIILNKESQKVGLEEINQNTSFALTRRIDGEVANINGVKSPAAEFLNTKKTWQGLGSDFENLRSSEGAAMEEGQIGIARSYTSGQHEKI